MCGIAGLFSLAKRVTRAPETVNAVNDILATMIARLHHRGPDGTGVFVDGPVGLAHARLSIIDLAGGAQPIHNEDKTIWVVLNGEIFNYVELRAQLITLGHRFYSFNKIRSRAGLQEKSAVTKLDILKERRLEFAIEFDYWFDLCRFDGFNVKTHPLARAIINAQDRGVTGLKLNLNSTDDMFLLPYPTIEVAANPKLKEAPVPYVFK